MKGLHPVSEESLPTEQVELLDIFSGFLQQDASSGRALPLGHALLERHGSKAGHQRVPGCGTQRQTGRQQGGRWTTRPYAEHGPSGASTHEGGQYAKKSVQTS